MKEATGELGTTVIVILALLAVIFVMRIVVPMMQGWTQNKTNEIVNTDVSQ